MASCGFAPSDLARQERQSINLDTGAVTFVWRQHFQQAVAVLMGDTEAGADIKHAELGDTRHAEPV